MLHGKHTRYTLGVFCYASVIFIVAPPTPDPKPAKRWRNSTTTRLIGRWMMRRWKSQRTWLTQWSRLWNLRPERPLSRMSPNKRHSIPGMCTLAWNQQVSQSYRRSLVFSYHTMRPQPSGTVHTHMKVELGILTGPLPGAQVSGQNGRPFFKPWSLCGTRMYRGPAMAKVIWLLWRQQSRILSEQVSCQLATPAGIEETNHHAFGKVVKKIASEMEGVAWMLTCIYSCFVRWFIQLE